MKNTPFQFETLVSTRAIVLLMLLILFSCKEEVKDDDNLPEGIYGSVQLFNKFGLPLDDLSGVVVYAMSDALPDSINFLDRITDKEGSFEFIGVPEGTYDIDFSKAGYSNYKKHDYVHFNSAGVDSIRNVKLYEPIDASISLIGPVEYEDSAVIKITSKVTFNSQYFEDYGVMIRYFYGRDSLVSSSNYFYTTIPGTVYGNAGVVKQQALREGLTAEFIDTVNTEVFLIAYTANSRSYEFVKDSVNNEFPSMGNPSNILKFNLKETKILNNE